MDSRVPHRPCDQQGQPGQQGRRPLGNIDEEVRDRIEDAIDLITNTLEVDPQTVTRLLPSLPELPEMIELHPPARSVFYKMQQKITGRFVIAQHPLTSSMFCGAR